MRTRKQPPIAFNGPCHDLPPFSNHSNNQNHSIITLTNNDNQTLLLHHYHHHRHLQVMNKPGEMKSQQNETFQTCVLDPCLFSSGMMRGPARFSKFLKIPIYIPSYIL
jgi:hypothetical protein